MIQQPKPVTWFRFIGIGWILFLCVWIPGLLASIAVQYFWNHFIPVEMGWSKPDEYFDDLLGWVMMLMTPLFPMAWWLITLSRTPSRKNAFFISISQSILMLFIATISKLILDFNFVV